MKFSVFGSTGYLGSSLIKKFKDGGIEYDAPDLRNEKNLGENLGHVIYAIGVPNFKRYPSKAIDAHVILLNKLLNETNFESFLYLSSTRIYQNASSTDERSDLLVNPLGENNLYNISKIMGEAICNSSKKANVRIVRLSNVTGKNFNSNLFLPSIIQESLKSKKVTLQTDLESEKDYVYIDDVLDILPKISLKGKDSIYNIASGKNITNEQIVKELQRITGCKVEVAKNATKYSFPTISIEKIRNEFSFKPISILDKFDEIVNEYKK
ncbi:MAG: NAD-dependent epimerase/dehydratase family protein [Candidatus Nitrosopumilus sp. bin_6a]